MYNILLFGPQAITQQFSDYLGNVSRSQSAMIYFEFPNNKFQHPTILKNFPEKLKFYILQPQLLHSVMFPKREFAEANLLIWMFDWNNIGSVEETYAYLKKIVLNRKTFLPIMLIGYRSKFISEPDAYLTFLKLFHVQELIKKIIQMPMIYFEITEEKSESLFFLKMKLFLDEIHEKLGQSYLMKHYSTISLEELLKTVNSFLGMLKGPEFEIDDAFRDLTAYELNAQHPLTRRHLQMQFGCEDAVAKKILDIWDERPSLEAIPPEAFKDLEAESSEMLKACQTQESLPNFISLVQMGYNHEVVKYALQYLLDRGKIASISHHSESQEYTEYRNIRDVIVVHEGRTMFIKSTNTNDDQIQLFSGMIQAIEMVRDKYLMEVEKKELSPYNRIEFLEFGDLKALIGCGQKGVKLILRLDERPGKDDEIKRRIKNFLKAYENEVPLNASTDFELLKQIRQLSEKIFYQNFNPFPLSFDVFKTIQINLDIIDLANKTGIEQKIIAYLRNQGPFLLEDLIENLSKATKNVISRSDFLPYIFDLIEDKIIV